MKNWYLVKVRHLKELEDGSLKEVAEEFLLQAFNYTHAEKQAHEKFEEILKGSFTILEIIKTPYVDVFEYDGGENDIWWKVKTSYLGIDGDKPKLFSIFVLVQAELARDAVERVLEQYKDSTVDYNVVSVAKTKISEYLKEEELV